MSATAPTATASAPLLDRPERRFPLAMDTAIPKIRDLYVAATRNQWDPQRDIDWDALDPDEFSDEGREAARNWWSRRGWGEYGAISESPTLSVRFTQDRLPVEMALFFALRTQEEARHAETCYRMAERLGGYIPAPAHADFTNAIGTHGVRKMALDPDTSVECIIAALVCGLEEYAFDWFKLMIETATHPVANRALKLILRDEVRHCAFGWHFVEARLPHMSAAEIERMRQAFIDTTVNVELTGYRVPWLAADSPITEEENRIDALTHAAGLGASIEEEEKPVFIACVQRVRRRFAELGIAIPLFTHAKLGSF
ncbi:MAG: ferritin-like domain-containing protein [Burkholderiales bacterium]